MLTRKQGRVLKRPMCSYKGQLSATQDGVRLEAGALDQGVKVEVTHPAESSILCVHGKTVYNVRRKPGTLRIRSTVIWNDEAGWPSFLQYVPCTIDA